MRGYWLLAVAGAIAGLTLASPLIAAAVVLLHQLTDVVAGR